MTTTSWCWREAEATADWGKEGGWGTRQLGPSLRGWAESREEGTVWEKRGEIWTRDAGTSQQTLRAKQQCTQDLYGRSRRLSQATLWFKREKNQMKISSGQQARISTSCKKSVWQLKHTGQGQEEEIRIWTHSNQLARPCSTTVGEPVLQPQWDSFFPASLAATRHSLPRGHKRHVAGALTRGQPGLVLRPLLSICPCELNAISTNAGAWPSLHHKEVPRKQQAEDHNLSERHGQLWQQSPWHFSFCPGNTWSVPVIPVPCASWEQWKKTICF